MNAPLYPKIADQPGIHHQAVNGSDDQALTEARVILLA